MARVVVKIALTKENVEKEEASSAKKTSHFSFFSVFVFFRFFNQKMVKIKVVVNKNRQQSL